MLDRIFLLKLVFVVRMLGSPLFELVFKNLSVAGQKASASVYKVMADTTIAQICCFRTYLFWTRTKSRQHV